jgi:hypothetical protein
MRSNVWGPGLVTAAALALAGGVAKADSVVQIGNFTLGGQGAVSVLVDDSPVLADLAFGALVEGVVLSSGATTISVLDDRSELLATRDADFLPGYPYTILVVGNGVDRAYEIRVVREDLHPLDERGGTIFWYNAAIHPHDGLYARRHCENETGSSGGGQSLSAMSSHAARSFTTSVACDVEVRDAPSGGEILAQTRIEHPPGSLRRVILVGDGASLPYELMDFESAERARSMVEPDARMDGLWFDPSDDGSGVSLMIDAHDNGDARVTGMLFGYGADGHPAWVVIEQGLHLFNPQSPAFLPLVLYEAVGGDPVDTRQPGSIQVGWGALGFHTCSEATLFLTDLSGRLPRRLGHTSEQHQQLYRLIRLLPPTTCDAAAAVNRTMEGVQ